MDIQFPSDIQVRYRGGPRRVPVRTPLGGGGGGGQQSIIKQKYSSQALAHSLLTLRVRGLFSVKGSSAPRAVPRHIHVASSYAKRGAGGGVCSVNA
jgi:hypothetical protein